MEKTYEPQKIEDKIYKNWMDKGYFTPAIEKDKKPFTIVIPPPNVTGELHMGHALDNSLQDIIIRYKRMQGYSALWLPGTDHASIATEAKVVDKLKEEGLTKEELGREKFLDYAWAWKHEYGGRIINQLKKLGCSCDWTRERFTMDEGLSNAVLEVFIRLYEKGLIYRKERITNWCPSCVTSISDIEVEYEEHDGHFWHINYPLKDSDTFVTIATTRPETMLGDSAVAVNPNDDRYKDLVGKTLLLPILNREIPIIADDYVDPEFGTGALKITPAHDPNDYEIGLRHNLPIIKIMDEKGIITKEGGKYVGLERYVARQKLVEDLKEANLLIKVVDHKHNIGSCQRCHTIIEPFISLQWYVSMEELAKPAIDAVKNKETEFIPDRFAKTYFNWMENIQDWCISRQLWWGHRIPAYYCQACNEIVVSKNNPDTCPKCGGNDFVQDPDTLDTWFSSALWPFSTLGWPDETEDFKYFYPTDVLVTGYDIIFFWVARMIFSGLEYTGRTPFKHVLIHGLVRAEDGRKMSKSLGNGIDPLKVIAEYGTDSLRYALTFGNAPGNDQRYLEERTITARNFTNKIWNATRFVLMNFDKDLDFTKVDRNKFTIYDKWILSKSNDLVKEVTDNLNKYELGIALGKIYDFIWDIYCDWYIEIVKPRLFDLETESRLEAQYVLNEVLVKSLKLLHPFMPFITEELYQSLIHDQESIMISKWPEYDPTLVFKEEEDNTNMVISAIRAIRNIRSELNVTASKKARLILSGNSDYIKILKDSKALLGRLASVADIVVSRKPEDIPANSAVAVIPNLEIFIPLDELIDIDKEIERLKKELDNLRFELDLVNKKLSNKGFVDKAPESVVKKEREKLAKYDEMYKTIEKRINNLKK